MIKCGMSEAVITPVLGSPIPGAGGERFSTGVKDDLYVKALVLETEKAAIAVLAFDAIDITRKDVEQVRLLVSRKTGIPEEHVQIASTHSHTSGPTIRTTYVNAVDETYLARRVLESEEKYPKTEAVLARQAIELAQLPDETAEAEIQAVAFGPEAAFVFLPGELFVEYGLAIKQQSPFRYTAVIELSNGSVEAVD
jgi:hypothetical protein